MSNTGFVDVRTAHAGAGSTGVPELGTFAPLAGPTVAPSGTVLLGTREGQVIALHADGSPYWNRHLPSGETITSSPVVGSDGSVYVVGTSVVRDHRGGQTRTIGRGRLYRFTAAGGAPPTGVMDFPQYEHGPTAIGAPNVWQFGSDEAIIVPALYSTVGGTDLHLLAFSPNGGVMADWTLYLSSGDATGDGSWGALLDAIFPGFPHGQLSSPQPPFPGVAIAASPQGGTPAIMLIDRYFRQTIGFRFCVGASCSPAPGFIELFRTSHAPRALWSSATILPDMHTVIGTDDGVVFDGPNMVSLPPVRGLGTIYATPTVAADGRVVLVNAAGDTIGLRDGAVLSHLKLSGGTIARAAASRTHVFIATSDALYTLDATATTQVFRFPWVGGGLWSPTVGPQGHVYAMASNALFVFPPPRYPRHLDEVAGADKFRIGT